MAVRPPADGSGDLERDLAARTAQLAALRAITAEITRELDVESLLGLINRRVASLLDASFASVWFWDEARERLVPRAWHGIGDSFRQLSVRLGEGITGAVAAQRSGIVVADYAASPLRTPEVARLLPEAAQIVCVVAEPLLYRDELIGVITLSRDRRDQPFTPSDQSLLRMFADQAAIALENALLMEREQRARADAERARRDAQFVAAASTLLSSSLDYATTLSRLANLAVGRLADWCVIDVIEEPGRVRRLAVAHADPAKQALVFRLKAYPPGHNDANPVERVLTTGVSVVSTDVTDEDLQRIARDPDHLELMRALGIAAYMMVPLTARGRTLGALSLLLATDARRWDQTDISLAEDLGRRAGAAIDNARLYRESEARRREAEELLDVASLVSSTLDPDAVGRRIVESVQQLTGATMAVLYRLEDASGDLHLLAGIGPSVDWNRVLHRGTATVGLAVRTREPVVTADLLTDPRVSLTPEARARIERSGYNAVLAVPLIGKDRVIGALAVADRLGRVFSADDVRLVRTFAHQAALALENARLYGEERAARGEAENANRMKDEFLAMLSHELRTPLTSIVGWTGLLLRGGGLDAGTAGRALETIDRNARLQTQLVEDLLDVSAIITGKFRLDLRPVEIGRVVTAVVESMRSAVEDKHLTLDWRSGSEIGIVRGDPDRLQQIVSNLLSNAIRFTPDGGRIQVALTSDAHRALLVVADTGRGIAAEFLPHVFDHFRQEESAATRRHRGLGLGLAIVRHLVELHGGEVRADSEGPGLGATFTVELPLSSSSAGAGWRASGDLVFDELPTLDDVSVLVVDDEPDTRELLRTIFEKRGARVAVATGAREAREIFARTAPRLVVSDLMMPDGDGYELVAWLRALDDERGTRTPAIALTAYASAQDRTRVLEAGFDMHVAKPIEPGELVEAVAALMAGRE